MRDVCQKGKGSSLGMTLIEVIVSLAIFLILTSLLPAAFSIWKKPSVDAVTYEEQTIFLSQLQMDFRENSHYWTNENHNVLFLSNEEYEESDVIEYEQYEDKVRRRVNGRGHEVFLQNVYEFQVKENPSGITIQIMSANGTAYTKNIIHPSALKE